MDTFLFTSESVNEGHPDKLCDQVSDAILDACLEQDPESKVASDVGLDADNCKVLVNIEQQSPDIAQVTVEYRNEGGAMVPIRVHTVLVSTQHDETVTNEQIAKDLKEHVIKPVIPPQKIIIDTYGGWGAHGGGAFSGKDPTKVDRSGAYIKTAAYGHFGRDDPDFSWETVKQLKPEKA
ncbi:unnamed protein product, partial [Vitis vinifera]